MATFIEIKLEKGEPFQMSTEHQSADYVSPNVKKDIEEKALNLCDCIKKCYDLKKQVERIGKHMANNLIGKLCVLKNAKSVKRYLLTESIDMETIVEEIVEKQDLLQLEESKLQNKEYLRSRMKLWNREQDKGKQKFLDDDYTSEFESSFSLQQRKQELGTELYFKMKKEQQVEEKLRKLELELGLDFDSKQADFDEIFASLQMRKKEMDRLERKLEETFKDIPGLGIHERYKHFAVSAIKKEKKHLSTEDSKFVLRVLECEVHFKETDTTPLIWLCRYATDEMFDALLEPSDDLDVGNILKENREIWTKEFDGLTLVHCAATNRSSHILKYLVENQLVNKDALFDRSKEGLLPLHYAALGGSIKSIEFLLNGISYGDILIKQIIFFLHLMYITKDPEVFKYILDHYIKSNCISSSENNKEVSLAETMKIRETIKIAEALRLAAKNNSLECVSTVWDMLCREKELNLNRIWNPLNDAMQYFIKEGNVYWTSKILQINNGSLGKKNLKCEAPIDSISYPTMKKLLDMQISGDKERDSEIILTNIFGDPKNRHDINNIKTIAKSSIVGLSKNEKLYNLALHPLCQAIVSVKFRRAVIFMYGFKTAFFLCFIRSFIMNLTYTLPNHNLQNNTKSNETNNSLLLTAMAFERNRTEIMFILYVVTKFLMMSLSVYLSLSNGGYRQIKTMLSYYKDHCQLGRKKIFSLSKLGWKEYLPYHDWHEYFFILFTFLWLYFEVPPVLAMISAFFLLFMVISQHPSILPLRFMFAQIVYRYITVLIFSFALIGGFSLTFYMIDTECEGIRCTGGLFETPSLATLKVISMMTGEYSFESFNFINSTKMQLLFFFFVILIACCLFNMINGLAFNITSELKKSAEVSRTIAQCQMIANFQSFLEMAGVMEKKFRWDSLPYDVAKIKVNLKSGALKIAEEYNKGLQYHVRAASEGEFFFDEVDLRTPKLIKWVWIKRNSKLDVQILRGLNSILGEAKTKQSIDSSDEYNESESDTS